MRSFWNIVIILLSAMAVSAANAQPASIDSIDQSEILPHLNSENIVPALKVVTGNHVVTVDPQNRPIITAVATNGLRFEIRFNGCEMTDVQKCRAMSLVSLWDKPNSSRRLKKWLPGFLINNALINAGILEDGRPYVSRYVIADFGTAQGNILSEFANFIRIASDFNRRLNEDI